MKSHSQIRAKQQREAEKRVTGAGYRKGGAIDEGDRQAVHKHERNMHKGEPVTKLRRGGIVAGKPIPSRIDRLARGGKPRGGKAVHINVMASNPQERQMAAQQGMRQGMQMGARAAAARMGGAGPAGPAGPPMPQGPQPVPGMAARPPMAGGAPPMGVRPMGASRGGKAKRPFRKGGMVKVRAHERRAAGGAV